MTHRAIGFAVMSIEHRREIARLGGRASQDSGRGNRWPKGAAASQAGRLGGLKVSADREHMRAIGMKGGIARHGGQMRIQATFVGVRKNDAAYSLDVVVEKITSAMIDGRMGSMPCTFRRSDGMQILVDGKGNARTGGWRIDPTKLPVGAP
jgi:general stress protein YciG